MKLSEGHTYGTRVSLFHNLICQKIAAKHTGTVVKELGDGLIVEFQDPVSACLAAIDIKAAFSKIKGVLTKGGLTIGVVEEIEIGGVRDLLGATVDRCARVQAIAMPGQILIDSALHDVVSSFLKDHENVCLSAPKTVNLKGLGSAVVYELSTKEAPFVASQRFPFTVSEEGRLLISEKVAFMQNARHEIIELGIGLTTFSGYFLSRRPAEFKDYVVKLLKQGVTFRCMFLDPNCSIAKEYAKDREEKTLLDDIHLSIGELRGQQEEFRSLNLKGSFELYAYRRFPYFHAVCVDPETEEGKITVSHYMHRISRAETPVFQFCKGLNKKIFAVYWSSIKKLLAESKQL